MSFQGISKSFDPMCSSDPGTMLSSGFAPGFIVSMSLRPAIPRRVALQHCSPLSPSGSSINIPGSLITTSFLQESGRNAASAQVMRGSSVQHYFLQRPAGSDQTVRDAYPEPGRIATDDRGKCMADVRAQFQTLAFEARLSFSRQYSPPERGIRRTLNAHR
jgi:hypothetical protein